VRWCFFLNLSGLHQLHVQVDGLTLGVPEPEGIDEWQVRIYYARYADDMLFGVLRVSEMPATDRVRDNGPIYYVASLRLVTPLDFLEYSSFFKVSILLIIFKGFFDSVPPLFF